jgi:hypothetical protein
MKGQVQNMKDLSEKTNSFNFDINMEALIAHKSVCDASINQVKENIQKLKK